MQKTPNARHRLTHLSLLLALIAGCSSEESRVWTNQSVAIDFQLLNPIAQEVCAFSATRDELTPDQVDGLNTLLLEDGVGGAGCDLYTYHVTVHAQGGSSQLYYATKIDCTTTPFLEFEDFDAWARSTDCSMQVLNPK